MKTLSVRIRGRMSRCRRCKGKGWYWFTATCTDGRDHRMKMACMECGDWRVAQRGVKRLESLARAMYKGLRGLDNAGCVRKFGNKMALVGLLKETK